MNEKLKAAIIVFRNGDREAFTEIYNLQYNHVYYIALQHAKNEQEAQDIAQESFIEIYKSLDTLKEVEHFNAWINRIVYSFFIKSIRSKQVSERVHLSETTNLEDIVTSSEQSDPSEIYITDEVLGAVEVSFQQLSGPLQEVARMRFFDELSISEISEVLNVPQGTVKSRIHKVRSILQENLSQEYQQIRLSLAPVLYLYVKHAIDGTQAIQSSKGVEEIVALAAVGKIALPKKPKLVTGTTAAASAAIIATPLLVVSLMNNTAPNLVSVDYDTAWSRESIPARIMFADDNANNQRVLVELNGGPVLLDDEGSFTIDQNGELTITYDEKVLYSTSVNSIDDRSPSLSLTETLDQMHLTVTDDNSGVNFDSISVHGNNNQPVDFTINDNELTIVKDDSDIYTVVGYDIAGNKFEYEIQAIQEVKARSQ